MLNLRWLLRHSLDWRAWRLDRCGFLLVKGREWNWMLNYCCRNLRRFIWRRLLEWNLTWLVFWEWLNVAVLVTIVRTRMTLSTTLLSWELVVTRRMILSVRLWWITVCWFAFSLTTRFRTRLLLYRASRKMKICRRTRRGRNGRLRPTRNRRV